MFCCISVKMIIEEIEKEEAALREELYSADRKFAEYYNVREVQLTFFTLFCIRLNDCLYHQQFTLNHAISFSFKWGVYCS